MRYGLACQHIKQFCLNPVDPYGVQRVSSIVADGTL